MSPIEARYSLNGEEKEKIATEDGVSVALDTPAGLARADLSPRKRGFLNKAALGERFTTQFPGQKPYRAEAQIFDLTEGYNKKVNMPELTRRKSYQTNEGKVEIELKAINSEPPKTNK